MSSDGKFWFSVWFIVGCVMVAGCFCGKGCNDSDNKLYQDAISKGCDVRMVPGSTNHQILCGPDRVLVK